MLIEKRSPQDIHITTDRIVGRRFQLGLERILCEGLYYNGRRELSTCQRSVGIREEQNFNIRCYVRTPDVIMC